MGILQFIEDVPELRYGRGYWYREDPLEFILRVWAEFYRKSSRPSRSQMQIDIKKPVSEHFEGMDTRVLMEYLYSTGPSDLKEWHDTATPSVTEALLYRHNFRGTIEEALWPTFEKYIPEGLCTA